MSDPIQTNSGSIGVGEIIFYDSIQPPLTAGNYTLSAKQEINDIPAETVPPYESNQKFRIDGPRFNIDPSSINTVYPPANQQGDYFNVLPHIVFTNFSLPWSRNINPNGGTDKEGSPPWMGLLTIYDTEMPIPENSKRLLPVGQIPQITAPVSVPVEQVVNPGDPSILPPDLGTIDPSEDERALVIDVNIPFFQGIAPTLAELPLLAHSREVNTGGKAMLGMDQDGCFALSVGNRVPKTGAKNTVFLVSFEGHQDHLPGGPAIPDTFKKIRLVVLGNWSFTASATSGSFLALMADLCKAGRGGVKLFQMPKDAATDSDSLAKEALEIGYVPLQNDLRVGEKSTSWYRGPFVPAPTKRDYTYGPYHYGDHAMHYDPEYGLFNHAYAGAWQIGRLMALSDPIFAKALFEWRRNYFALQSATENTQQVEGKVADAMSLGSKPKPLGYGVPSHTRDFVMSKLSSLEDTIPQVKPREGHPNLEKLPGIINKSEANEIIDSGEDPILALKLKKLVPSK